LKEEMNLANMSWVEVEELLRKRDAILIPFGSIEQHGPHLPLGTDSSIVSEIVRRVSAKTGVAFTPPMPYGYSIEHLSFPGSTSLAPESLMGVAKDVCESMIHHGFKRIILINGHGGNAGILETVIQSLKAEHGVTLALINITDMVMGYLQEKREPRPSRISHADVLETSLMLAIDDAKVKLDKIKDKIPTENGPKVMVGAKVAWRAAELSSTGVIGELRDATKSDGERLLGRIVENIVQFVNNLK